MRKQRQWVEHQLRTRGYVSRNEALQNYLTRLAEYIRQLRSEGWEIEGDRVKTEFGEDYQYKLKVKETLF